MLDVSSYSYKVALNVLDVRPRSVVIGDGTRGNRWSRRVAACAARISWLSSGLSSMVIKSYGSCQFGPRALLAENASSFPVQQRQEGATSAYAAVFPEESETSRSQGHARRAYLVAGLAREARPTQWLKNILVLTAPLASGPITHRHELGPAAFSFAAFRLASGH